MKPGGPTITALGGLLGGRQRPAQVSQDTSASIVQGEWEGMDKDKPPPHWRSPPYFPEPKPKPAPQPEGSSGQNDLDLLLKILNGGKTPDLAPQSPLGEPSPEPDSNRPFPQPPTTVPQSRLPGMTPSNGSQNVPTAPNSFMPMPKRDNSLEEWGKYKAEYEAWVRDNWEKIQKNKELQAMGLPPLDIPTPPLRPGEARELPPGVLSFAPSPDRAASTAQPPAPTAPKTQKPDAWVDLLRDNSRKKASSQNKPADPFANHTISEDGAFEHDKYAQGLVRDSDPNETARYLKNVITWNGDVGRGDVADLLGRFAKIDGAKAKTLQDALHQASGERIPFRIAPLGQNTGGAMADLAEGASAPTAPTNPFGPSEGADRWEAGNMAKALLGRSDYKDAIKHFQGEVAKDRTGAMPYLAAVHEEMAGKNPELAGKFAMQMGAAGLAMKTEAVNAAGEDIVTGGSGDDTLTGNNGDDSVTANDDKGDKPDTNQTGDRNTKDGGQTGQGNGGEQVAQDEGEKPAGSNSSLPEPTKEPVNPQALYDQLGYDANGNGDYGNAAKNPLDAIKAKSAANAATKAAKDEYGKENPSLGDGDGDAFRHALWAYKMAKEIGDGPAKAFGDAHERDDRPDGERLMDLYNNALGRQLAADPNNQGRPDEDVIREAIRAGKLQTRPFNVPGPLGGSLDYPPRR